MKFIEQILKNSPCYKKNQQINVKGLMLHSIGCNQPKASVLINNFNKPDSNVCPHAIIDAITGDFIQILPWNWRAWHAGRGANNTHIAVEMCEPDCIRYISGATITCSDEERARDMVRRTYESAVHGFADLCDMYHLNPLESGVIVSHSEGYKLGIASNHADPEHLWKQLKMGYTMDGFRQDVDFALNHKPYDTTFLARINVSGVAIRKGPGANYDLTGEYTGNSVFTIVETKAGLGSKKGWGKLKSGAGWISLDECDGIK